MARFLEGTITPTQVYCVQDFQAMLVGNVREVSGSVSIGDMLFKDDEALFNQR